MDSIDTRILSEIFKGIIQEWLSKEELEKIDAKNRTHEHKHSNLCATHEFCDPNQAMIDALGVLGFEFDTQNEEQGVAIERAWQIAKTQGFSQSGEKR